MRIESSNLSYMKVPGNAGRVENEAGQRTQRKPQSNKVTQDAAAPEQIKQSASSAKAKGNNAIGKPLSKYLSSDEREMLNGLFPATGQNVGVTAYRQGQNSQVMAAQRGQHLDLTS